MSLSNAQIVGSRAAPRDPRDLSGRRPASVFNDRRQYRMAEDTDNNEDLPPRKEVALSNKGKNYRTKAIHRSFGTPASARASARAQVDEIVSGGDDSDDNFRERLNKELDADRIARLREMNKQRLEALEKKLLELHRQKHDIDGQSDEDAHPSYFRHTKDYKPESYSEPRRQKEKAKDKSHSGDDKQQTSDEGVTTDDGGNAQSGVRFSAGSGMDRGVSGSDSEGPAGYVSDPGQRKPSSMGGDAQKGARLLVSESAKDLSRLMLQRPPRQKRTQTKKEPFRSSSRR